MTGWRGVFVGVLALVALEAVVSTRQAANRTAGLFGDVAAVITRVLDPNVAAIPDLAGHYATSSTAAPAVATTPAPDPPANGKPKPRKPQVAPPPATYSI